MAALDCAGYFWEHPVSAEKLEVLIAPLDMPFEHVSPPFDGWVDIEPHSRVVRVNPTINPKLYEIWQSDLLNADEGE